jgi:hypothetical protein
MVSSRFLDAVAPENYTLVDASSYVEMMERPPRESKYETRPARASVPALHDDFSQETVQYRVGQHVVHKLYGQGEILSLSGFGIDMRMTVLFTDGSRRRMMAKFADFN